MLAWGGVVKCKEKLTTLAPVSLVASLLLCAEILSERSLVGLSSHTRKCLLPLWDLGSVGGHGPFSEQLQGLVGSIHLAVQQVLTEHNCVSV